MINDAETCRSYLDALADAGVEPYVWGYPWQGNEEAFVRQMRECAGDHRRGLLDSELGANPRKKPSGVGFEKAEAHAVRLVDLMASEGFERCGLSSFGSGVKMGWFPMRAFILRLLERFDARCFVGGQTYTENKRIDASMADYIKAVKDAGASLVVPGKPGGDIALVPNFGQYKRVHGKTLSKTPEELYSHLGEFIDENEPVSALIGWAENFCTPGQWRMLQRFAVQIERGACSLPL